jgi:hypothetical protein
MRPAVKRRLVTLAASSCGVPPTLNFEFGQSVKV